MFFTRMEYNDMYKKRVTQHLSYKQWWGPDFVGLESKRSRTSAQYTPTAPRKHF